MSSSLRAVRGVILDVDGVLLDARPSYHAVAEEAARRAIVPLVGEGPARAAPFDRDVEIAAFKNAGGFNDDWEMSRAIALLLYLRARQEAPDLGRFLAEAGGHGVRPLYEKHPVPIRQETVARLFYRGKPNRHLRGLRLSAPAATGAELRLGDRVVGQLGSAAVSPSLGPIALALVRREAEPGVTVSVGEHGASAEVVALPFPLSSIAAKTPYRPAER